MILDKIAMAIGYFVMFIIGFTVFVIIPLAVIGRAHAERNARIYDRELKSQDIDPHIDPTHL